MLIQIPLMTKLFHSRLMTYLLPATRSAVFFRSLSMRSSSRFPKAKRACEFLEVNLRHSTALINCKPALQQMRKLYPQRKLIFNKSKCTVPYGSIFHLTDEMFICLKMELNFKLRFLVICKLFVTILNLIKI